MHSGNVTSSTNVKVFVPPVDLTYSDQLDWRTRGAVTSVKNQVSYMMSNSHFFVKLMNVFMYFYRDSVARVMHLLPLEYLKVSRHWLVTSCSISVNKTSLIAQVFGFAFILHAA